MNYLQPTAPLAERVLLPGDPGRALRLAQALIDGPKMFNHARGLWGYSGTARDGEPLTIQSSGIGGPSAAAIVSELVALGAQRVIRVGTARALTDAAGVGSAVVVDAAAGFDGASRAIGAASLTAADPGLLAALRATGALTGRAVSADVIAGPGLPLSAWRATGALVLDLETAAVFAAGGAHGAAVAAILTVTGAAGEAGGAQIAEEDLHAAELQIGERALRALGQAS